jgi:hypothetical protein
MSGENGVIRQGDGDCCPVCGGPIPPSLGSKPRKYCSAACCSTGSKGISERNKKPHVCMGCGVQVQYPGRGPRDRIRCGECRKRPIKRTSRMVKSVCVACGKPFDSAGCVRKFCSRGCRYRGAKTGHEAECKSCGKKFKVCSKGQNYCSRDCSTKGRTKVYVCLCCGVTFNRKIYKSGAYSKQTKYCTRECAFKARRLRLECTKDTMRPGGLVKRLADWFFGWGEDQWPRVFACQGCGKHCKDRDRDSPEPRKKCYACLSAKEPRNCLSCGVTIDTPFRRRCGGCAAVRSSLSKRECRRRRKRIHGNFCTHRKRCRKAGVPYTPVSRRKIFDRDKWKCRLCGCRLLNSFTRILGTRSVHPRSPTLDHVIPLAMGPGVCPGHIESNLQAACWECNTKRGATPLDQFAPRKATQLH